MLQTKVKNWCVVQGTPAGLISVPGDAFPAVTEPERSLDSSGEGNRGRAPFCCQVEKEWSSSLVLSDENLLNFQSLFNLK